MLLIEANNVKKMYAERVIFEASRLEIHSGDRIGLVGRNGSGKTTLIKVLNGELLPDTGIVRCLCSKASILQLEDPDSTQIDPLVGSFYKARKFQATMSEGEKERLKIAEALSKKPELLFADEPTSNLDLEGINRLTTDLVNFAGAFLIISHDRHLLDTVCSKIWELENGKITEYRGNYSDYKKQKADQLRKQEAAYENYLAKKRQLTEALMEKKRQATKSIKPPKNLNRSEARLGKDFYGGKQKKLARVGKALETRIDKIEKVDKPYIAPDVKIPLALENRLYSKVIVSAENLTVAFGEQVLLQNASFEILNGHKVAITGANGAGKTTLLKLILNRESPLKVVAKAKFGYFSQKLDILNPQTTILENVLATAIHTETIVRSVLARLLFKNDYVYKRINVLSGGEQVKVALAKVLLSDINVLVLDEPTNYLDIESMEALEELLKNFEGTVIFVSHDQYFLEKIATQKLEITEKSIHAAKVKTPVNERQTISSKPDKKLLLQTRLSEIIGKLSFAQSEEERLTWDREYIEILAQLKEL